MVVLQMSYMCIYFKRLWRTVMTLNTFSIKLEIKLHISYHMCLHLLPFS